MTTITGQQTTTKHSFVMTTKQQLCDHYKKYSFLTVTLTRQIKKTTTTKPIRISFVVITKTSLQTASHEQTHNNDTTLTPLSTHKGSFVKG